MWRHGDVEKGFAESAIVKEFTYYFGGGRVIPIQPFSGVAELPLKATPEEVPLSFMKITSVLSARPEADRFSRSRPRFSSMQAISP